MALLLKFAHILQPTLER